MLQEHVGPRILRVPWRFLAPVLTVVLSVAAWAAWRSRYEYLADWEARYAGTRFHETPWLLWCADTPDGLLVAEAPGAGARGAAWKGSESELQGEWPLRAPDGTTDSVAWRGLATGATRDADGTAFREFVRGAYPADLERLGRDADLVGAWDVMSHSPGCGQGWSVDLRPDGSVDGLSRPHPGRWAGGGRVVVLVPGYAEGYRLFAPRLVPHVLVAWPDGTDDEGRAVQCYDEPARRARAGYYWTLSRPRD